MMKTYDEMMTKTYDEAYDIAVDARAYAHVPFNAKSRPFEWL